MTTAPKLCKDCRWCVPKIEKESHWLLWDKEIVCYHYATCSHPDQRICVNLVDGRTTPLAYCDHERENDVGGVIICGKEGKLWEAKG